MKRARLQEVVQAGAATDRSYLPRKKVQRWQPEKLSWLIYTKMKRTDTRKSHFMYVSR